MTSSHRLAKIHKVGCSSNFSHSWWSKTKMTQTEYTLVVHFSGKSRRYPLMLDDSIKHYGLLAAQILGCLRDLFVDPLPNPKHLLLKSSAGEFITDDGLWERSLGGYYPADSAHIISVEQGKSSCTWFWRWIKDANMGGKTARQRLWQRLSRRSGLSQASCYSFPSWVSMRSKLGLSSARPQDGKSSTRGTSPYVPSWVGVSS